MVDLMPCLVRSKWPLAVAIGSGGKSRMACTVRAGMAMKPFRTASKKLDAGGEPNEAWWNATRWRVVVAGVTDAAE